MRVVAAALFGLGLAGCTIERVVPLEDFACTRVGGCGGDASVPRDAGMVVVDRDSGPIDVRDAGPKADVPIIDSGVIELPSCPGLLPIDNNTGLAIGNTSANNNGYEGECHPPGGKDAVYGFTVPGRLSFLQVSTGGSSFDTTLHFYENDCAPTSRLVCTDETEYLNTYLNTSEFRITNVAPGSYAAIVDAFMPDEMGDYVLRVTGAVRPGELCDPNQKYLPCLIGTCGADEVGVLRCPDVLDCADGIDADIDGATDEDAAACDGPPTVSCNAGPLLLLDRPATPSASVNDNGTIIYREWTAEAVPRGSYSEPRPRDQDATMVLLDIDGPYRLRYVAADDDLQLSACETTIDPVDTAILRAEVYWSPDVPRFASTENMFIHLLHPTGTRWFDAMDDCGGPPCFDMPLDWDQQGDLSDDPLWIGYFYGPQRVYVDSPRTQGRYAIGVDLVDLGGKPAVDAYVRIYCGGVMKQEFGPATLTNGNFANPDQSDFWKVAEVQYDSGGDCTIFPFGNGTDVIVRTIDAAGSR